MNLQTNSVFSILTPKTKPVLTRNETHPDKVLITPFMQQDGVTPKTDLQMRPIGSIMLTQEQSMLNGGFLNVNRRVCFLSGTIESLQSIIDRNKLKHGSELPGKVVVYESLQPFFDGQQPKMNPTTKAVIQFEVNGTNYPVFYQTRYSENENEKDVTIRSVEDVMAWLNARNINAAAAQRSNAVVETSGIPETEQQGA